MKAFFGSAVLCSAGLFFVLTAASAFSAPRQFGQRLGFTITGPDGSNEVRAQYGGFFLALAVVNGRITSLFLDGGLAGYGGAIRSLFVVDATGFAFAIAAFLRERSSG